MWTRKENTDDDTESVSHNHDEKDCPPISDHFSNPLYESTEEKEKTEFNGRNRGI